MADKMREKLKSLLSVAVGDGSVSIRQLAKIAGSVISLSLAVGTICCLFSSQMYHAIESRSSGWDQIIPIFSALLEELSRILAVQSRSFQRFFYQATSVNVYRGFHRRQ